MTNYKKPNRNNRPHSTHEPRIGRTVEVARDREKGGTLADGRPYVVEAYGVDGYTTVEYWFDVTDLEDATVDELARLLRRSGIGIPNFENSRSSGSLSANTTTDADGAAVWRFACNWEPDF